MTRQSSFRLSDKAKDLLFRLADYHGLTKTATLELLIREAWRRKGR